MSSALSVQIEVYPTDSTEMAAAVGAAKPTAAKVIVVVDPSAVSANLLGILAPFEVIHQASPRTVLIGRVLAGETAVEGLPISQALDVWWKVLLPIMQRAPYVSWEGPYNEFGAWEQLGEYGQLEAERQRRMTAAGLRACIGNFSAHARLYDKLQPFRPALDAAKSLGSILGLHGYLSPHLSGPEADTYLYPHRPLRAAYGDLPATVLTEFGIDRIPGANELDGWRTCLDGEAYYNELLGTEAELQRDGIAACVYLWSNSDQPDKVPYNIGRLGNHRPGDFVVVDALLGHVREAGPAALRFPAALTSPQPATTPPAGGQRVVVSSLNGQPVSWLNIRNGPGMHHLVCGRLFPAAGSIEVEPSESAGWVKLKGQDLYVSEAYLRRPE